MSKLANALGKKFEQNKLSILTRTFEMGSHTFKVRVPAVHEIERIFDFFKNPDENLIQKEFEDLIASLNLDEKNDLVVKTENDVLIDNRSMRETAKNKLLLKYRITEYFKFLIPENGTLDDIEYQDIDDEFPLSIQLQLVDKINEVISPDYKEVRSK